MKSFHNTTDLSGASLQSSEKRANREEAAVTEYFRKHQSDEFTPCQIWQLVFPNKPLGNIRRAITNLTNAGVLCKTGVKVLGYYGVPVNTWRLRGRKPEQQALFS